MQAVSFVLDARDRLFARWDSSFVRPARSRSDARALTQAEWVGAVEGVDAYARLVAAKLGTLLTEVGPKNTR
jgi:hypothetical protein